MLEDFDETVAFFMREYGKVGVLIIQGEDEYDYDTNTTNPVVTEYEVKSILLDLTLQSNGQQVVNGTVIEMGDKRVFIQPLNKSDPTATMPKVHANKDRFRMGGIEYKIVTLKETNPTADNLIMLELYLRQ